jgi:hypothetical protein
MVNYFIRNEDGSIKLEGAEYYLFFYAGYAGYRGVIRACCTVIPG